MISVNTYQHRNMSIVDYFYASSSHHGARYSLLQVNNSCQLSLSRISDNLYSVRDNAMTEQFCVYLLWRRNESIRPSQHSTPLAEILLQWIQVVDEDSILSLIINSFKLLISLLTNDAFLQQEGGKQSFTSVFSL